MIKTLEIPWHAGTHNKHLPIWLIMQNVLLWHAHSSIRRVLSPGVSFSEIDLSKYIAPLGNADLAIVGLSNKGLHV